MLHTNPMSLESCSAWLSVYVRRTQPQKATNIKQERAAGNIQPAFLGKNPAWIFYFFKVSLCKPGWSQTLDPPASASQVLRLQACFHHDFLMLALMKNCLMPQTSLFISLSCSLFTETTILHKEFIYPTTSRESELVRSSRYLEAAVSPTKVSGRLM